MWAVYGFCFSLCFFFFVVFFLAQTREMLLICNLQAFCVPLYRNRLRKMRCKEWCRDPLPPSSHAAWHHNPTLCSLLYCSSCSFFYVFMLVFISLVAFVLGLFLAVISVEAELTPSRCHVRITLMSKRETSSVLSGRAARLCPGLRIYSSSRLLNIILLNYHVISSNFDFSQKLNQKHF